MNWTLEIRNKKGKLLKIRYGYSADTAAAAIRHLASNHLTFWFD